MKMQQGLMMGHLQAAVKLTPLQSNLLKNSHIFFCCKSFFFLLLLLLVQLEFVRPVLVSDQLHFTSSAQIAVRVVVAGDGRRFSCNCSAVIAGVGRSFVFCRRDESRAGGAGRSDAEFLENALNISSPILRDTGPTSGTKIISNDRSSGGRSSGLVGDGERKRFNGVVVQWREFSSASSGSVVSDSGRVATFRWETGLEKAVAAAGEIKSDVGRDAPFVSQRIQDGIVDSTRTAAVRAWRGLMSQPNCTCSSSVVACAFMVRMRPQQEETRRMMAKCLGLREVRRLRAAPVDDGRRDHLNAVAVFCCCSKCSGAVNAGRTGTTKVSLAGSRKNSEHHMIRGLATAPFANTKLIQLAARTRQWEMAHHITTTTEKRDFVNAVGEPAALSENATQVEKLQDFAISGRTGFQKIPASSNSWFPSSTHAPAAAAATSHIGRRSLQASNTAAFNKILNPAVHVVQGAAAGRWWQSPIVGVLFCVAGVLMLVMTCAHGTESTPAEFLESVPSLPPRFSYASLDKATRNFSRKLGDGAFGSVYEGFLPNGSRVAVKVLEKTSVQGEKQFRAEVASMGAIRHLNLVRLFGFCSEGSHRLLVYEFMANGSLDSWLFGRRKGEKMLDWEQRLNIALGTARALAYLHEECSDHIIHLDVKPENILLDHQFCAKLSDFGLAKLMEREQSRVVTSMRGTPGYLAPEWLLPHAAVTAKTDVYSFGMVLLELISGRENTNFSLGTEQWYFPAWAFKLVGEGRTMELFDRRLEVEEVEYFHKDGAVRALHTALLCIQDNPGARPSMSRVVHMLQGHVEQEPLNIRSQVAAIQPPRRLRNAFAAASRSDMKLLEHLPYYQPIIGLPRMNKSPRVVEAPPLTPGAAWWLPTPSTTESIESEMIAKLQGIELAGTDDDLQGSRDRLMPPLLAMQHHHQQQQQQPQQQQQLQLNYQASSSSSRNFKHTRNLVGALQISSSSTSSSSAAATATAPTGSGSQKCIPPWPVKGDVILLRGPGGGDSHGVVRDVRPGTKQMRVALLHRVSSDSRWSVREEEKLWRHWNESIKTLDFWVVLRWSTVVGHGYEKVPVEWMAR